MKHKVFGHKDTGSLFSHGVSRAFGENKMITTDDGFVFLASVQPLKVMPFEYGMVEIGVIETEDAA